MKPDNQKDMGEEFLRDNRCFFCGQKATMRFTDYRTNEISTWCDNHSNWWILTREFRILMESTNITSHWRLARMVNWYAYE